ncbi:MULTISPECIES: hypothetical protein [Brevundimonas]|jgi:hypothetical protein|uniref:hypothetical protein n=1 Tax=Brevundimonas TaxID=41275 RepID=UPI0005ED1330|nr:MULTISPECIES: hypothetical protein [Brevundimonas]
MAGAHYDGIEAIFRIAKKGEVLDTFAIEVLTFHAAVEYELEVVLRKLLPHPDKLFGKGPKLSFPHKARLLCAMWRKDPADADKLNRVLKALEDLRNEVAHQGDIPLKSHKANLSQAFREIEPRCSDDPSMLEIAQGISMFIADDAGTLADFSETLSAFDVLVNQKMPSVLGVARQEPD